MGERGSAYRFWWEKLRERDQLEEPGIDGRIILSCIFRMLGGTWIGLIWLRTGTGGGLL